MLNQKVGFLPALASLIAPLAIDLFRREGFSNKHVQKMVMIPEHLMQSIKTEHHLRTPAQLMTLARLDQDMKQIKDSSFPEDQKVLLLNQLLQRYQGLTKQMKVK